MMRACRLTHQDRQPISIITFQVVIAIMPLHTEFDQYWYAYTAASVPSGVGALDWWQVHAIAYQ